MTPILQIRGLTKKYGGLTANNNISNFFGSSTRLDDHTTNILNRRSK